MNFNITTKTGTAIVENVQWVYTDSKGTTFYLAVGDRATFAPGEVVEARSI